MATSDNQRFCGGCGARLDVEPLDDIRKVGQYRLEREIARGGMGVVYVAHD